MRVASEGATAVLRKAAALYVDRFGDFFRVSWKASGPALLLLAGATALFPVLVGRSWLLAIAAGLLWGGVTFMTHGAFAALIATVRERPLAPIDMKTVFARLNRGIGLKDDASIWSTFARLLAFYTTAELKAPAGSGDLAFQIAFHEGRRPSEIGDRCRLLARTTKESYSRVKIAIFAPLLIVPPLEAAVVVPLCRLAGFTGTPLLWTAATITVLSLPLVAILVNPMLSSALALLYFRARQANGEDVGLSAVVHSRL